MRARLMPSRKEIRIISDNISLLDTGNRLDRKTIERPLKFVKSFINDNPGLWGEQLTASPNKFPVLAFTHEQVALIDDMISSNLKAMRDEKDIPERMA